MSACLLNNVYSVKQHHISFSAFLWFFKANCEPFSEMIKIPANTYSYFNNRFRWACFNPSSIVYPLPSSAVWHIIILAHTKLKSNSDSKSWSLKTVVAMSASFNENYYCLYVCWHQEQLFSFSVIMKFDSSNTPIFCNCSIWFLHNTNIL